MSHSFARQPSDLAQNLLINGQTAIAQRQQGTETTLTSYADDAYCTADRWYVLTQTTTIQTALATGDVCQNSLQLKQNQSTGQRMGVAQIVEAKNSIPYQGKAMRFNFRFKISNDQDVRVAILEHTGTADSVTSDVVNDWTSSTYTASNFFISTTVNAVKEYASPGTSWVDAYIDATLGSSVQNIVVFIWTEGTAAQNVTLDVESLDLHLGQADRDFDPRPIAEELSLCKRYLQYWAVGTGSLPFGRTETSTQAYFTAHFDQRFRVNPTFSVSAVTAFNLNDGGGVQNSTNTTWGQNMDQRMGKVTCVVSSGLTVGNACDFFGDAGSWMQWTAEL